MKYFLPVTLLILTIAGGFSMAADPPAQPATATPVSVTQASPLSPLEPGTDGKKQSTRATVTQSRQSSRFDEGALKANQTVDATTPQYDGPGYTQIGSFYKVKLDRPKTHLSLVENSSYSVYTDHETIEIVGRPDARLVQTQLAYGNGISFQTLKPGVVTLNFMDKESKKKEYQVELTILGDTRQLQTQLSQLYPRASIKAIKVKESVLLRGTVSKQEHIAEIIEIAEQFYPRALNQLKVAGAPVGQTLSVQPKSRRGHQAKVRSGMHKRMPASVAITTSKPQITVPAIVLEIDWKKLKESKIDLESTIRAFTTDPRQRDLNSQATKKSSFIPVVVPWRSADSILHLLTATRAVKVISRPVISTVAGRSADVFIGEKIPIVENKEIRNGKHVLETVYHNIGTTLKLTPELASHGGTKLSVVVEHQQRVDSPYKISGKSVGPGTQTRIFALDVGLKVGQSVILTQISPLSNKQKKQSVGKGLMVILSPPVIGMAAKNYNIVWSPVTTLQWIPEQNRFANVTRMVPKPIQTKTGPENSIYSGMTNPYSSLVPQAVRVPVYVDPTPASQPEPQDLRHSVRALRSDVRALRQDVGRLLKILEKKETSWNELRRPDTTPAKPTMSAIHRRIKESKTDLLVFHASWSGPCQKMASLLDEQAYRGYSIRRLDIDQNRDLAKEFNVTSVPAIVAFANGKEDERWVGMMGKDALTRIVDKYAPRRNTTLKGSRQSSVSPAERKLNLALENQVSLDFEKMPLADVVLSLAQSEGINIVTFPPGLEEEGVESKTPITMHTDGITLKSALNLMLKPLNLAYHVRDESLVITSRIRTMGKLVVRTYPVADLIIPIPLAGPVPVDEQAASGSTKKEEALLVQTPAIDFNKLTDLIQSTVRPDSWEMVAGPASIRSHKSTLSLVIRQTSEAHQEIEGLLTQLRRLQDVQVTVESRFLDHLPENVWKQIGISSDSKQNTKGPWGGVVLTDQQATLLLQTAQNNGRSNSIQAPKVTLFNGQTAGVTNFIAGDKQHPLKHSLHMQPVISADRRNVRLNLRVSDLKSSGAKTQVYVNTVPDGKAMLIEFSQRDGNKVGVPISEKSKLFKSTSDPRTKGRRFFLIRPRIMVQEEEEEAILPPHPKLQSMLMLTPRGIISEEEEALLGIEKPE